MTVYRAYAATLNTVHGEDDIYAAVLGDMAIALVADGVSSTGGAAASWLATLGFAAACQAAEASLAGMRLVMKCLESLDGEMRESSIEDARVLEAAKKRYYMECSRSGKPCTKPLELGDLVALRGSGRAQGDKPPATTLLGLVGRGDVIGFLLAGDGYLFSAAPGKGKEKVWLLWGAFPQYISGVRVASIFAVSKGFAGDPVVGELAASPGRIYVVATDGVSPGALGKKLASAGKELLESDNPATELLEGVSKGGDDASIAMLVVEEG